MGFLSAIPIIGDIFDKIFGGIDKVSTTDEERLQWKSELHKSHALILGALLEAEKQSLEAQKAVLASEMQYGTWLTRSWRPITMLCFTVLIVWHSIGTGLGYPVPSVPDAMWSLIQLGLGGYVVGRSLEKTAVNVVNALKKKEQI